MCSAVDRRNQAGSLPSGCASSSAAECLPAPRSCPPRTAPRPLAAPAPAPWRARDRQDGVRESGSKACYQLCPRASFSVPAGSRISFGDHRNFADRRGRESRFDSHWERNAFETAVRPPAPRSAAKSASPLICQICRAPHRVRVGSKVRPRGTSPGNLPEIALLGQRLAKRGDVDPDVHDAPLD
jgi:hypothetical protein